MESLGTDDQALIARLIETKQANQFASLYAGVVRRCFGDCVNDFTSESLARSERECIQHCTTKLMRLTSRIGEYMAERQQAGEHSSRSP